MAYREHWAGSQETWIPAQFIAQSSVSLCACTSLSQMHPPPAARTLTDAADTPGSRRRIHSFTWHLLSAVSGTGRPKSKNYAELAAVPLTHPVTLAFAPVLLLLPPLPSAASFSPSGKLLTLQIPGHESTPLWRLLSQSCYNTIP